ncbi:galactose-1-phosphate uridylyltransferase [Peptostreptococcus faecalis]|uniref:galactose-1-phosphate uridylyltransferase n=1 Tax=Peptostreptococcus faecalis TaxID=2045015 RepID=UPI000C7E5C18|nr:DUF4931 domain-containing protein [Peptostreptococcus faecalis]
MKEVRKDLMTGDLVIYSSFRNERPHDVVDIDNINLENTNIKYSETCPFCRGNEVGTEDLMDSIYKDGSWIAKSVKNKFPIVDMSTKHVFGEHEVVVETHRHEGSYFDMSIDEFESVFKLFKSRSKQLSSLEGVKYVNIFKNSKKNAGASLSHPHSQIMSISMIPPEVEVEMNIAKEYKKEKGSNLYEDIIKEEIDNENRVIYNGEYFLVFVPYASKYNGEVRIIAKSKKQIDSWNNPEISEISYIYINLFKKIKENQGEIPFNTIIHTTPLVDKSDEFYRTHIHIIPRKYNFGGFELSTDFYVSGTDPQNLASELRFK